MGRRTLARDLRDLPPEDAADLKVLVRAPARSAVRLDRIEQELEAAGHEIKQTDSAAAENLAAALEEARRAAIGAQMRSAGGRLQENQVGQAAVQHKQILHDLQEVLNILAGRRRPDAVDLRHGAEQTIRLDAAVKRLQQEQRTVLDRTRQIDRSRQAEGQWTRLMATDLLEVARRQESLAAETGVLTAALSDAGISSAALSAAGDAMGEALAHLDGARLPPPSRPSNPH